ncbi:hypothetical protein Poly30_18000 [Planctomycetes bacterium Poly30]|uniref:Glycosyltransferase RgtA/B/C/D-like domain-containing protein n=1 Tax=Saltatorellus ferox TaxID=2528018 RepID=A0A518EQD2_9BACT|nr:hypothetical protein Poly30_18000 [Planctomycetes bacterium Poly30]
MSSAPPLALPSPAPLSGRGWIALWLLIGLALRLYPILWGSAIHDPDQFALHPDESKIVRYADDFPDSLATNEDFRYPLLVHHVGSLAWWPVKTAFGWGDDGVLVKYSEDQDWMPDGASMVGDWSYERALLFLRALLVLIFGLGGTLLILAYARRLGFGRAGPWIAAATALQPWPVVTNAVVQTDTAGAFMLLLVFHVALVVDQRKRFEGSDALRLGLALGAAVAARYTSGIGVVAVLTIAAAAVRRGDLSISRGAAFLAKTGAVSLATFVAIVPGCVYRFEDFKNSIVYEYRSKQEITSWDLDQFWDALTQCAPVWILVPSAVGLALLGRGHRSAALLGAILSLSAYFATAAKALVPDYCMPLMPLAAACTGITLSTLSRWRPAGAGRAIAAAYVLCALGMTAATVYQRYASDTRYRADDWIKAHIPPGPLGFPPSALGKKRTALRAPAGYEFVDVHTKPEWIVFPRRRFLPIYNVFEDPNYYPRFPFDPVKRTLGRLGPRDFDFFEDVLFERRRGYRYDLVETIERSDWPLDYRGYDVRIYRKSAEDGDGPLSSDSPR